MRRARPIALAVVLAVCAVLPAAAVPGGLPRLAAPAASLVEALDVPTSAVDATVKAGVGVVDATWHVGASSGQYSSFRNPAGELSGETDPYAHRTYKSHSYGVQSRLTVRAIVVEGSNGERVALVKSDNYLAQDLLTRRVGQILAGGDSGITSDRILHAASHNHSSPYYSTAAWGVWVFQDVVDLRMFEYSARAMAEAIEAAADDLRPARMGATTIEFNTVKGNVQGPAVADDGTPAGYPRDFGDDGLVVMRFDDLSGPEPTPLAVWMNFGQHPESLDGYDLITADFLAPLERMVERATGAPLLFTQGDVGSAEGPYESWGAGQLPDGTYRAWAHVGHAQTERGARLMADAVLAAFDEIEHGTPQVPFSADFPVDFRTEYLVGPISHPYPSVSNCRTESTVEGNPGAPIAGLPDCARRGSNDQANMLWENLKQHGLPVPDHYDAPSFMAVEENARLMLQTFKVGEVLLASCACEAQVDLILNLESRTDTEQDNLWLGYDWGRFCTQGADTTWTCPNPTRAGQTLTVSDLRYRRMQAQVLNDARGWDAPEHAVAANSEPADPAKIWGNFTHEELPAELGYTLPVGVGHAGDYNGYTVSYREYMSRDHYRKALTSYGPHTADYMNSRLQRMAGAMNGGPELAPEPHAPAGTADEARQEALARSIGAAASAAYDQWQASLADDLGTVAPLVQPKDITRFDAASFTWRGGTNAVDNPVARVERLVDGAWQPFADMTGEVQTTLAMPRGVQGVADAHTGRQEWRWTATFEAFDAGPSRYVDSTPEGTYRFVVDGQRRAGGRTVGYTVASEPFTVSAWQGLSVASARAGGDGSVVVDVATVTYPRSYLSPLRYVRDDGRTTICKTCTFRPWAQRGEVASVAVTVHRADGTVDVVAAERVGDAWVAPAALASGDRAEVAAGGVRDAFGNTNGIGVPVTG